MYRCELCNRVSRPGERATKVVIERRPTEYPSRGKAQRSGTGRRGKSFDDPGGAGYEIAKEKMVCAVCAEQQLAKEASQNPDSLSL